MGLTSSKKTYSWNEISKHNTRESCWIVAHKKVYDVTEFISDHPGSSNAILKHAGKDCSVDFDFHSYSTQKLWKKYYIGKING